MSEESAMSSPKSWGCSPLLSDAKWFTHCRRPRLFWAMGHIQKKPGEALVEKAAWQEWQFPICRQEATLWLDKNCRWLAGEDSEQTNWLPTFTRPQRRKRSPHKPAGLREASREAFERWRKDNFYLQVYKYEDQNMIKEASGQFRLVKLTEKELLMGFDTGYISESFGPKTTSAERELIGEQMIGNTFCVYSIMMLLHELLQKYGDKSPQIPHQLVNLRGDSLGGWTEFPKFVSGTHDDMSVRKLVSRFIRIGERGGLTSDLISMLPTG